MKIYPGPNYNVNDEEEVEEYLPGIFIKVKKFKQFDEEDLQEIR